MSDVDFGLKVAGCRLGRQINATSVGFSDCCWAWWQHGNGYFFMQITRHTRVSSSNFRLLFMFLILCSSCVKVRIWSNLLSLLSKRSSHFTSALITTPRNTKGHAFICWQVVTKYKCLAFNHSIASSIFFVQVMLLHWWRCFSRLRFLPRLGRRRIERKF